MLCCKETTTRKQQKGKSNWTKSYLNGGHLIFFYNFEHYPVFFVLVVVDVFSLTA